MQRRTIFYIFIAVLLGFAVSQSFAGDPAPLDQPIQSGVGFKNTPPSYLVVVKSCSGPLQENLEWYGSGSFISNRLVLTVSHNVEEMEDDWDIVIQCTDGTTYRDVEVVHQDETVDLALLRVKGPTKYHRCINVQDTIYWPKDVSSAGFCPTHSGLSLFAGKLGRSTANDGNKRNVYRQTTAFIEPGMSGGPIIDDQLCLHGVLSWRYETDAEEGETPQWLSTFYIRLVMIHKFLDGYEGPYQPLFGSP